jgi:uncharacterized membrane protein YkvA (DUF1232 family)
MIRISGELTWRVRARLRAAERVDMSLHTLGIVVLSLVGALALLALALIATTAYAMYRFKVPPRGIAVALGALIYMISPIGLIPDALFGPFGLIGDGGVLLGATMYILKLIAERRAAEAELDAAAEARPDRGQRPPPAPGQRPPDPRVVDSHVVDSHIVDVDEP